MPKFRVTGAVGWVANSKCDFGVIEAETQEEAEKYAWEMVAERVDVSVEETEDE